MTNTFEHLHDIDITKKNIDGVNPEDIKPKHLPKLKEIFIWHKENSSNKEVILASNNILQKIDIIMNLEKNKFSWQILAATADDYQLAA